MACHETPIAVLCVIAVQKLLPDRRAVQIRQAGDTKSQKKIMVVVAQLVEHRTVTASVAGSNPVYHPNIQPTQRSVLCYVERESFSRMKQEHTEISKVYFGGVFIDEGFEEVIFPAIWEEDTFINKVGSENANMMWRFADKGNRNVCLVPEITGMAQEMWSEWSKTKNAYDIFYVSKCYRYERPQKGRYREFTQIGIEMLGSDDVERAKSLLRKCLDALNITYEFDETATRGLSYYTNDGFEARVESLGAQKQIAGGGVYNEGVGWAVGLDRLMLAMMPDN